MSEPKTAKFFTYEDGEGHVFIADSLEEIPEKYQKLAQEVSMEEAAQKLSNLQKQANTKLKQAKKLKKDSLKKVKTVQREVGDVVPFVKELDLPSVAVGFSASLVFFLVLSIVKKTGKLLLKLSMLALIVCLLGGAYFGWLRKSAGLSDGKTLATPQEVIRDAKRAAGQYQKRLDLQEDELKKIDEDTR